MEAETAEKLKLQHEQAVQRDLAAKERKRKTEAIREQHRKETEARMAKMVEHESKREAYIAAEKERLHRENQEAQEKKQARLQANQEKQAYIMAERKRQFEEKDLKASVKRHEFEEKRRIETEEAHERARQKRIAIESAINTANQILEGKKEEYRQNQRRSEARLALRREKEQRQAEIRHQELLDKEADRKKKLQSARDKEAEWIRQTVEQRQIKNEKAAHANDYKVRELNLKRISNELGKIERQEYVVRKQRVKNYANESLKQRFENDRIRTREMKTQYEIVAKERKFMQAEAIRNQKLILEKFEEYQLKHDLRELDIDNVDVRALGLVDPSVFAMIDSEPPPMIKAKKRSASAASNNRPEISSGLTSIPKKSTATNPHASKSKSSHKEESKEDGRNSRNTVVGFDNGNESLLRTQHLPSTTPSLKKPLSARLGASATRRRLETYAAEKGLSRTVDRRGYFSSAAMG